MKRAAEPLPCEVGQVRQGVLSDVQNFQLGEMTYGRGQRRQPVTLHPEVLGTGSTNADTSTNEETVSCVPDQSRGCAAYHLTPPHRPQRL